MTAKSVENRDSCGNISLLMADERSVRMPEAGIMPVQRIESVRSLRMIRGTRRIIKLRRSLVHAHASALCCFWLPFSALFHTHQLGRVRGPTKSRPVQRQ